MNVSTKKKNEFDKVLKIFNQNNMVLDIDQLRNIFLSEYYDSFLLHIDNNISHLLKQYENFYLHIDISMTSLSDLYYYDKIIEFAKILHKYTLKLPKIFIYESSIIFTNLIELINNSLQCNVSKKIIFQSKSDFEKKMNFN